MGVKMEKKARKARIVFGSLHIEVEGPPEMGKERKVTGCVTDFLKKVKRRTRGLLAAAAKKSA
jgi:hypothetical protein